jgi:uncharacterized protein (DUF302 family)
MRGRGWLKVFASLAALLIWAAVAQAAEYGVYVKAVEGAKGPFGDAVKRVEDGLKAAGWDVLASYESGVEARCDLRAHTIVAMSGDYAGKVLSHGPLGAFALPVRVGVYEDEQGIHVAFSNPASINRTVLGDGVEERLSVATMDELVKVLAGAGAGKAVKQQIGQLRGAGKVGGMGGGDFAKKVEDVHTGGSFADIAAKVKKGIEGNKKGWRLVYAYERPDLVIFGVTNPATEARAFGIAGERRQGSHYRCPGLDHAAAFPIEVVVYKEGGQAKVATLDEMYRMKLYFEDAGNWAFMKNMAMPGEIEDEVVEMSRSLLGK